MLGSVMRVAVGVPEERLDLLAQITRALHTDSSKGSAWHAYLNDVMKNGLPDGHPSSRAPSLKPEPIVLELGEFEVNYDQSISAKMAHRLDPVRIGMYDGKGITDDKFPDSRKGKVRYAASAVCFRKNMLHKGEGSLEEWCRENKKILARPKEVIDLAKNFPRPKLDHVMPLMIAGQFFAGARGGPHATCLGLWDGKRDLNSTELSSDGEWSDHWWFLVLEIAASKP